MLNNLEDCKRYMNANRLALNKPKTKIFAVTEDINIAESLSIPGMTDMVKNTKTINVLGITVDAKMKMNSHIMEGSKCLLNQLTTRLTALKKLVKVSDRKFSLNLANGLFMSKLLYGIQAWGLAPKYLLNKIQVLQNKAARVVQGYKSYKLSTTDLLKNMKWLNIEHLIILNISILVHGIINTGEPSYFYERIVRLQNNSNRTNMGRRLGQKPVDIGTSTFTKNQFCSRAFDIYNCVPAQISSIKDKKKFKSFLKKYLFDNKDLPDINEYPIAGLSNGI